MEVIYAFKPLIVLDYVYAMQVLQVHRVLCLFDTLFFKLYPFGARLCLSISFDAIAICLVPYLAICLVFYAVYFIQIHTNAIYLVVRLCPVISVNAICLVSMNCWS